MTGFASDREERDAYLVITSVVSSATALCDGFKTWIEEEVSELGGMADDLHAKLTDLGYLLDSVTEAQTRMRDIEREELPLASRAMKGRIKEVSGGTYDDVMDARQYLDEGLHRFERIQRELLRYRGLLDTLKGEFLV